eukprot:9178893-Pyramimonas_sp.AAC.1
MTRNGRSRRDAFWPLKLPDRAQIKMASGNKIEYHGGKYYSSNELSNFANRIFNRPKVTKWAVEIFLANSLSRVPELAP